MGRETEGAFEKVGLFLSSSRKFALATEARGPPGQGLFLSAVHLPASANMEEVDVLLLGGRRASLAA